MRYLKSILSDSIDKSKPQFIAVPTIAFSPETNWEFGISTTLVRYAKRDTNNRLSELNAFTFYTIEKQYGTIIEHAFYSDKNKWFFLGKCKIQSFPLAYHGIGPESSTEKLAKVDAFQFQLKERFLRQVIGNFYLGLETDINHLGDVSFIDKTLETYQKPIGHQGSTNFGLGIGALYDNRHNVLNVRDGFFAETAFLTYHPSLGSSYNFSSIFTDVRYFLPIRNRNVLAFQTLGQFSSGNPPFNQLALMGGENMMRGYYLGRYRDKNFVSIQSEYRMLPFSFSKRFGASVFCSTGIVFDTPDQIRFNLLKFSGGLGLRILVFPKKDIWTRIDFAINNEGGTGIYIFMGEAF